MANRPQTPRFPKKNQATVPRINVGNDIEVVYGGEHEVLTKISSGEQINVPPRESTTTEKTTKKSDNNGLDDTGIYENVRVTLEHEKTVPKILIASLALILIECILVAIYSSLFIPAMNNQRDSQQVVHILVLYICDMIGTILGLITAFLGIFPVLMKYDWGKQLIFTHCFLCGLCVNIIICFVCGILGMIIVDTFLFLSIMVVYLLLYALFLYIGVQRVKLIKTQMESL